MVVEVMSVVVGSDGCSGGSKGGDDDGGSG